MFTKVWRLQRISVGGVQNSPSSPCSGWSGQGSREHRPVRRTAGRNRGRARTTLSPLSPGTRSDGKGGAAASRPGTASAAAATQGLRHKAPSHCRSPATVKASSPISYRGEARRRFNVIYLIFHSTFCRGGPDRMAADGSRARLVRQEARLI